MRDVYCWYIYHQRCPENQISMHTFLRNKKYLMLRLRLSILSTRFDSELITISFKCFPCSRYWCEAIDWWEVWCNNRSVSIYDLPLSCLFQSKKNRVWYQLLLMLIMTMIGMYSNIVQSQCGSVALIHIKDCWVGFCIRQLQM